MYYKIIRNNIKEITFEDINPKYTCIGYITLDEFNKIKSKINIDEHILKNYPTSYRYLNYTFEIYDNYSFSVLNIKDINQIEKETGSIGLYLSKNLLIFIILDDNNQNIIVNTIIDIIEKLKKNLKLEQTIYYLIEKILTGSFEILELFENKIINIEKEIFKNEIKKNLNQTIFLIKKQLMLYKQYYEYLLNFIINLKADENNIFNNTNLRYINNLEDKVTRLSNNTEYLIENAIHLRETYQSSLDFYQNRIIKLLTIITTIFLPLSLIAGWYGMNFKNMPEINSEYGYSIIIIISLSIIIFCLILFKRKKII